MNLISEDRIKSIIYGGLDGILTVFSIITATLGTNYSIAIILIIGVSNIFSDGVSMALGDYFSTATVNKFN